MIHHRREFVTDWSVSGDGVSPWTVPEEMSATQKGGTGMKADGAGVLFRVFVSLTLAMGSGARAAGRPSRSHPTSRGHAADQQVSYSSSETRPV